MGVVIIAEAGVNHNGDINKAKELIDKAIDAKVDYIKFQTFITEKGISKDTPKAIYQKNNTGNEESQYQMIKKLELSFEQHKELFDYCNSKNIKYLSTGFDKESLDFLKSIGIKIAKIPSGEITNLPYLKLASKLFSEVIISTGMATMDEIREALQVFLDAGISKNNITLLHCNTEYPTPFEDVNLKAMLHLQKEFDIKIGYSDHTLGIEVPIAAVTLGATVIEKHFTLDKNMEGPDHRASLEPNELKQMVQSIRNIEKAISGSGIKEPSESEKKNINIARKSIVASRNIKKGEIFSEENLTTKRPGNGISPMKWDEIIGQVAKLDIEKDTLIKL